MWPGAEAHLPKLQEAAARILAGVRRDFNRDFRRF